MTLGYNKQKKIFGGKEVWPEGRVKFTFKLGVKETLEEKFIDQ